MPLLGSFLGARDVGAGTGFPRWLRRIHGCQNVTVGPRDLLWREGRTLRKLRPTSGTSVPSGSLGFGEACSCSFFVHGYGRAVSVHGGGERRVHGPWRGAEDYGSVACLFRTGYRGFCLSRGCPFFATKTRHAVDGLKSCAIGFIAPKS